MLIKIAQILVDKLAVPFIDYCDEIDKQADEWARKKYEEKVLKGQTNE